LRGGRREAPVGRAAGQGGDDGTALAERNGLRSPIDSETLATMTVSLINGLQAQWLFDRDSVKVESAIRQFFLSVIPGFSGAAFR
jgi:hypothetical protein